jgi:hypothetical protein
MRKLGFLAAAAGLAVSGSVTKADFVVSSNRVADAGAPGYDLVSFTVTNDGTNSTGTTLNSIDIALYAPTSIATGPFAGTYANNGMLIGVGSGAKGGLATTNADVFASNSANNNSWIADNTSPFTLTGTAAGSVLLLGANPTTTAGVSPTSQTFTNNELVAGISGAIFSSTTPQADGAPGVYFAQAVVPTGMPVELLNPVTSGRAFEPNSGIFSPLNGSFQADNLTTAGGPLINGVAVPEPASFAMVGIGAAGLLARRRRMA